MTIIDCREFSERLKRTQQLVRKAARDGRFGDAAHRDATGRWLFEWPRAEQEFRRRTDPGRYAPAQIETTPKPAVKVPTEPAVISLPPRFTDLAWFGEDEREESIESFELLHQRLRNADGLNSFERGEVDEIFALATRLLEKHFSDVEQQHLNYFGAKP